MYRIAQLCVLFLAAAVGQASAIEMFTNFHNGENIGFPPMQVPYSVYGGIGHGGWNPHAQGMPLKADPFVPAMSPTGQIPGGRCFNYYGAAPIHALGTTDSVHQKQLVSDRRHGRWQRGATNSDIEGNSDKAFGGRESGGDSTTSETTSVLKNAPSSGTSRRSESSGIAEPTQPKAIEPAAPTIVHAESANSEILSHIPLIENTAGRSTGDGANLQPPATPSEDSPSLDWPRADAIIPHSNPSSGDAG